MNILFLDIDGVLNSAKLWARDKPKSNTYMTRELCERFSAMLDQLPDVKIVMSSTWRMGYYDKAIDMLSKHGVSKDRFIGKTPIGGTIRLSGISESVERGIEIQQWLDAHPGVEKFVILDDNSDMAHLMPHLVKTTWEDGLQDSHCYQIIERLK